MRQAVISSCLTVSKGAQRAPYEVRHSRYSSCLVKNIHHRAVISRRKTAISLCARASIIWLVKPVEDIACRTERIGYRGSPLMVQSSVS